MQYSSDRQSGHVLLLTLGISNYLSWNMHWWRRSLNKLSMLWPLHGCCNKWRRRYQFSVERFQYYWQLHLKRNKKSVYIMNEKFSRKKFEKKIFGGKRFGQIKSLETNYWQKRLARFVKSKPRAIYTFWFQ